MSTKKPRLSLVTWGNDNGPIVGCVMRHVVAWVPAGSGQTDVWFESGAQVRYPISATAFGNAHAAGMGYPVEKVPEQVGLQGVDEVSK